MTNTLDKYMKTIAGALAVAAVLLCACEAEGFFHENTVSVAGVSISQSRLTLGTGSVETLMAIIEPSNATNQEVTWSSSNSSVATVNALGVVTGISGGSATIKVITDDGGKEATCDVTVTALPAIGTWTKKAAYPGIATLNAVGFSIGNKGYIGTGNNYPVYVQDFWEYDPVANSWTQKANFAGGERRSAVGFSIGNKGYIGGGFDDSFKLDFWEYDPVANSWTKKANFPGNFLTDEISFSIDNKGYITYFSEFWEFTP